MYTSTQWYAHAYDTRMCIKNNFFESNKGRKKKSKTKPRYWFEQQKNRNGTFGQRWGLGFQFVRQRKSMSRAVPKNSKRPSWNAGVLQPKMTKSPIGCTLPSTKPRRVVLPHGYIDVYKRQHLSQYQPLVNNLKSNLCRCKCLITMSAQMTINNFIH